MRVVKPLGSSRIELIKTIVNEIPPELNLANIDFEGPNIVIYIKNRKALLKHMDLVKNIAKKVHKRIVLRVVEEERLPQDEARKKIMEIVPKDAGVDPNGIEFDEVFGDVWIRAEKAGLIVSKGYYLRQFILAETGWRPIPRRAVPLESKFSSMVFSTILKGQKYRFEFMKNLGERIHRDIVMKNNHVRVTALGGFMEVGRSAVLIETKESRVLLDFGVNIGSTGLNKVYPTIDVENFNLPDLDAVIVTHAHLDHIGAVPLLFKYGYRGPVYVTRPTRDLMAIMLKDFLDIASREGKPLPYSEKDLVKMILHTITLEYNEVTDVAPDIKLTMYNAGHILGSAIAHLHIGSGLHNIVYTGDFKFSDTRLLDRAHTDFPRVETLIMETTYGATFQQSRSEAEAMLVEVIRRTCERNGVVLIPVFAVGRGQEVMIIIKEYMGKGVLPKVNVYIDGLVNEVTAIHAENPEYLSRSLRGSIFGGENPFTYEYFKMIEGPTARTDIVEDRPSVIIATSGMLNGGPAVEYLKLLAGDPRNTLLFVGYQSEGTLGRRIKDGLRELNIMVENKVEVIKVNMEVFSIDGFSGHSDQKELLNFVESIQPKPKCIVLNHGERTATLTFAKLLSARLKTSKVYPHPVTIYTPNVLDSINLTPQ